MKLWYNIRKNKGDKSMGKFNVNRQEFPHFRKSLDFQVVG